MLDDPNAILSTDRVMSKTSASNALRDLQVVCCPVSGSHKGHIYRPVISLLQRSTSGRTNLLCIIIADANTGEMIPRRKLLAWRS